MGTPKQEVGKLLETLPDDVSYEDIQYHIHVREKIERGLKAVEEGKVISEEETDARFKQWLVGQEDFFADRSLAALAEAQQVKPIHDLRVLQGGIPEDEDIDQFLKDIYSTRR